jgi:DNA-binding transcriptional LysR family regulator
MQDLGRMGVFAVVAEELSLSKAAEKLGCTKSAVSKQITALEIELGVKLLYRSTRRSRLTDEGQALYQTCGEILQRYYSVKDIAEQIKATPAGNLSLEMPDGIATYIVLPHIQQFREQYPLINLNLTLRQASFQEVTEDLDVAIVSGQLPESSVVCRRLGHQLLRLYASAQYLEKFGTPATPAELKQHQCIVTENSSVPETHTWIFHHRDELASLDINAAMTVNDILAVKQLVLDGAGVSILQDFAVRKDVEKGRLIALLPTYTISPVPIYVIYPERKHLSPKIRAMVDFLAECFSQAEL